ncbi:hypothetical protein QJQ45_016375, partial [Haematococcus lacustris]
LPKTAGLYFTVYRFPVNTVPYVPFFRIYCTVQNDYTENTDRTEPYLVTLMSTIAPPVRVVVVGASFAGRRVKLLLDKQPNFVCTLIDAKDFFEYTPSVLRCLVEPKHAHSILVSLQDVATQALVTGVDTGKRPSRPTRGLQCSTGTVQLANGQQLPYDYLVFATGSSYASPIKPHHTVDPTSPHQEVNRTARLRALEAAAEQLRAAASVVVVGGGTVGVELAAEVAGHYGFGKKVTLVCSDDRLLARMPLLASTKAVHWLEAQGVEVLLGQRVATWPKGAMSHAVPGTVLTSAGRSITADLVYNCTGVGAGGLNTELYSMITKGAVEEGGGGGGQGALGDKLRRKGVPVEPTLQVTDVAIQIPQCTTNTATTTNITLLNPTLAHCYHEQVKGFPRIYACGDVADLPFERCSLSADMGATCVAANIQKAVAGQPQLPFPGAAVPLCPGATAPPTVASVSLYKWDGVMQFQDLVITGPMSAIAKSSIERFQLALAVSSGSLLGRLWLLSEAVTTILGAWWPRRVLPTVAVALA